MNPLEIVESFLQHIFTGKMDEAMRLVAPTARFIAARTHPNPDIPLYGTFVGPDGAREFFHHFTAMLEPREFETTQAFADGDHVAMYGTLRHCSRSTGRDYASDWALICRVQEGRLCLYHFYEDTVALESAVLEGSRR